MRKKALVVRSYPLDPVAGPWAAKGFDVRVVSDLTEAVREALSWRPDVVALDLEGRVSAVAAFLREWMTRPETLRTPVVLISPEERQRLSEVLMRGFGVVREFAGAVVESSNPTPLANV